MKSILINTETLQVATGNVAEFPRTGDSEAAATWTPPAPWKYVPMDQPPTIDPDTQRIERETTADKYGWKIVAIPADELAARATAKAEAEAATAEADAIRTVLTALRNGTGTAAERLARLERVVFRLAKQSLQ